MLWIVVFDTNVLFSSVGWRGTAFRCVELARSGAVDGVTCPQLMDDLAEKLETKLHLSAQQVADTLADLLSFLRLVTITQTLRVVPNDPDDDKVVECAVVAGASHLVTGDRRHLLPLERVGETSIISPAAFLQMVTDSSRIPWTDDLSSFDIEPCPAPAVAAHLAARFLPSGCHGDQSQTREGLRRIPALGATDV